MFKRLFSDHKFKVASAKIIGEVTAMETQAKVVIVGGGIMGVALAYHLAEEGETDVLLI